MKTIKKTKTKHGSVLVFSLIILFMGVAIALGVAFTSIISTKMSTTTGKSVSAFQVADSGAEIILQKIASDSSIDINQLAASLTTSCYVEDSESKIKVDMGSGKNYTVTFADSSGNPLDCSASVSSINRIKSVGTYAQTTRAIDVAVAQRKCDGIWNTTILDSSGDVGKYPSAALGSDGLARISYYDDSNNKLKFIQCTNADCSTKNTTIIDDGGSYNSIAIGSNGNARISYQTFDVSSGCLHLKFVQCTNADCSTNITRTVDNTCGSGFFTSMALGSDGFARIAYYVNGGFLKFVRCTTNDCQINNIITTIDNSSFGCAGGARHDTALALNSSNYARISYYDEGYLKLIRCGDLNCSSNPSTNIENNVNVGTCTTTNTSLALDSVGNARIAYHRFGSFNDNNLMFVRCDDDDCSPIGDKNDVDITPDTGQYNSLALGSDGFARISYYDSHNNNLKFAQCDDSGCTDPEITTVDPVAGAGDYNSIALGSADNCVSIVYYANGDLKYAIK
jgi:hypothetical protein